MRNAMNDNTQANGATFLLLRIDTHHCAIEDLPYVP
jgi:hypothetical protein